MVQTLSQLGVLFPRFAGFTYQPVLGGYQEGITRRDPSPVIRVGDLYHVWYSRTTSGPSGYNATIWHATSSDGVAWTERGQALARGGPGTFDEHGVFTPSLLVAGGCYYMSYTAVPEPFYCGLPGQPGFTRTAIGLARAISPFGPWARVGLEPILGPSDDPAQFDSLRVDDSCFIARQGRYWLYYKGRQQGRTPRETKMGLAVAAQPEGPYVKCSANPVLDSGHEVCVWPHGSGVAALVSPVGPQGGTLQYSADGVRFQAVAQVDPPKAPGPYRADEYRAGAGPGITWGLCMDAGKPWPHLLRFTADLRAPEV